MAPSLVKHLVKFWKNIVHKINARAQKDRVKKQFDAPSAQAQSDAQETPLVLPGSNLLNPSTDSVLKNSRSAVTENSEVQGIALSSKPANDSVPEPDTEVLHPSRSTTSSESPTHDNDRRSSGAWVPSAFEPFPCLHEEPCSISGVSQSRTPPPLGHHSSDTSAKRNYYEQDDKHRIIPKHILCYLKVKFEGRTLSKKKPFEKFDWQNDASYDIVSKAAQAILHHSPETINKKNIWRTDGVCKLFVKEQECSSKALEAEDQWSEVLHLIIAEFVTISGNEYKKFHLEITWTYAAVEETVGEIQKKYSKQIAHLIDARMKPNWRERNFIPQKDLHAIMSSNVIEHLIDKDESLKELGGSSAANGALFHKKQFVSDITNSHKKLLALCVHEDLPLICLWQMLYAKERPVQFPLTPLKESDRPAAADQINFGNILLKQWFFTAFQFPNPTNAKVHCIELRDNDVLPIEKCGDELTPIGHGASKVVYKVQIQPGHHRFTADKTSVFALKEFKNGATFMEFERESKVLRKLLEKPHKNITPHYASWSQAGHFFMLSPLASCNLKVYWKNNRPELSNSEFVLWELRQLSGLADGLRYIYNLGGWHHDLKAENVLVFEEGDGGRPTLKIADFGSAKIRARRPAPQDESSPTDSYSQGTSAYEAPDYVILGETSRPYDVWTLACLFMDMLVWTFGSRPSELEMFSNERRVLRGGKLGTDTMFWCVEQHNGEYWTHWKPFVEKRLQNLKALCDSDQGSRRAVFKELVNTISKMLRMDPVQRVKAFEVHNDLERVTLWAEEAVKDPAWKIQHLLIGATPSTDRSETSGESNLDGIPVRAPRGYLMMPHPPSLTTDSRNLHPALWQSLRDGSDLKFMGANENLVQNTNSSKFHMVVDPVVDPLDTDYQPGDKPDGGLLIGSHLMSADGDNFAEAQTAVASVAASESHLPSLPLPSITMVKRDDGAACM